MQPPRVRDHIGPSLGFRVWPSKPMAMEGFHAHADIEVNLITTGRIRYFIAGSFHEVGAGCLAAFWGGLPHRLVEAKAGTQGVWMTMPLGWFLAEPACRRLVDLLLSGRLLRDVRAEDRRLAAGWLRAADSSDPLEHAILRREAEVRLLCLARGTAPVMPGMGRMVPDKVEDIATLLAARCTDEDLDVARIASSVRLHPHYAMQLFRQALGITIWEYLLRLRVAHAQRLLLTTDHDMLRVAFASGFGSAARFYAAFKRIAGTTPRVYRTAGEQATTTPADQAPLRRR